MNTKTHKQQLKKKQAFCAIQTEKGLAQLLNLDLRTLQIIANQPRYSVFSVPKKNGKTRLIENPERALKTVQTKLNAFLQSVYYCEKSWASYGFVLNIRNDEDRRNILTNAKKHLGKDYLLNLDLKSFFHYVTDEMVKKIFRHSPFGFRRGLPELLTKLTTYHGRLPMGTPTSPVLSNLACRGLDEMLIRMADDLNWTYTRYTDDMSFSSHQPFKEEDLSALKMIVEMEGFAINSSKVKTFGPNDEKIVTGLLLENKVKLVGNYLPELRNQLKELKQIVKVQNLQGSLSTKWVDKFKDQIRGKITFAGFVLGKRNKEYIDLKDSFYTAISPPEEDFGAFSWKSFPYVG